jgi:hypothetical protein
MAVTDEYVALVLSQVVNDEHNIHAMLKKNETSVIHTWTTLIPGI